MQPGDDVWYKGEHYAIHSMFLEGKINITPRTRKISSRFMKTVHQNEVSTTPPKYIVTPGTEDLIVQRFKLVSAMESALRNLRDGKAPQAACILAKALDRKLTPEPTCCHRTCCTCCEERQ